MSAYKGENWFLLRLTTAFVDEGTNKGSCHTLLKCHDMFCNLEQHPAAVFHTIGNVSVRRVGDGTGAGSKISHEQSATDNSRRDVS